MNMYRSLLKISVMLLLVGNFISFGMIVRYKNQEDKKQLQASVKQEPIYPMTVDEVLKLVEEDKKLKSKMTVVPKVSKSLKDSDEEYLRDLFGCVKVREGLDSEQRPLFENLMVAIAKKDYNDLSRSLLGLKQSLQFSTVPPNIRSFLSYQMYFRSTKDRNSFELVSQVDPFTTHDLVLEMGLGRSFTLLDNMTEDFFFDQENIKIYKKNGGMTIEEVGRRNLEILYKNQDPQFVLNFLRSHYVPVIVVDMSPVFIEEDRIIDLLIVSPYKKFFYANPEVQFIGNEKEIEELGNRRFDSAHNEFFQKRLKLNPKMRLKLRVIPEFSIYNFKSPLMNATLFGDDEDVSKELENSSEHRDVCMSISEHIDVSISIMASISSPHKKNNALECLLLKLNLLRQQEGIARDEVVALSYELLSCAANNKEAFELISQIDPCKCNTLKWKFQHEPETQTRTNLDRMIKDKNFDQDNMRVYRDNGGMTTEELHKMDSIGDILKKLPRRDITLTDDEEIHVRRFANLSF